MTMSQPDSLSDTPTLRVWPGIVLASILVILRFLIPFVVPGSFGIAILGGLIGSLLVIIWWLTLSRALWSDRLGAILLMLLVLLAASKLVHDSIRSGMMGMLLPVYALPVMSAALVAAAASTHRSKASIRRAFVSGSLIIAGGVFLLLRTDGVTGEDGSQFAWRWTASAEQRLLAQPLQPTPTTTTNRPAAGDLSEWPGFRGSARDSIVRNSRIDTNWVRTPPVVLWRRPIGPGWSSFAARSGSFYTQEQRGEEEIVACYRVDTGEPVWQHRDSVRFWESNAGAGPRATPTLSQNRLYTLGATGILNALDSQTGTLVWSRNVVHDTGIQVPVWGFSGSPLIEEDLAIVAVSGQLAAYAITNGSPRWFGPKHGMSYSSPHRTVIAGKVHIVLLSAAGATGVAPQDGAVLWEHAWKGGAIVQPALTLDGDILVNSINPMGGIGLRRLSISHASNQWAAATKWTSTGLKPYFSDFIVHRQHALGFDGGILACIDLVDGQRKWKGGRFGHGQLLLLQDQDCLLVLTERGDIALVEAALDDFREIARSPAIAGKTWNHPVLLDDVMLVRNSEEMAALRLPKVRP